MEKKQKSVRWAFLIALAMFGAILFYASRDRGVEHFEYHSQVAFGLDVDLEWVASADQADFAVVQDTLSFYAEQLGLHSGALSSRLKVEYWGEGKENAAAAHSLNVYHMSASLDFGVPDASIQLLNRLVIHGYLEPGTHEHTSGTTRGLAQLHLPIPNGQGKVLHMRGTSYEMSFASRFPDFQETEPDA
jgi:hypothetical protein